MSRGTILVTGGAGYIGSHVCKALAAAGWLPVTYDNLSRGHEAAVKWGPLERGDLLDTAHLTATIARHRPVAVAHLAGLIAVGESVREPLLYWRVNVGGSESLLSAMRANRLDKLVFSSTCAIYGAPAQQPIVESCPAAPVSPYAWSKLAIEQVLADCHTAFGLSSVALRYFNAAGADPEGEIGEAHDPETHLIPLLLEAAAGLRPDITVFGEDYPTPDGTCIRDYLHVADIAAAHLLALDHLLGGGERLAVNLGNGSGFSVREVIAVAEAVSGRTVPVTIGPRRPGDPPRLVGDARLAGARLGWRPAWPRLEDQVAHAWAWLQRRRA
ncbi:MAG: UDP-glucose 4-epimerase GalE [Magnetospirillum sp.]|nr:UDP-glucose 4-epimerase GalE [Magnetospirillum sp.]